MYVFRPQSTLLIYSFAQKSAEQNKRNFSPWYVTSYSQFRGKNNDSFLLMKVKQNELICGNRLETDTFRLYFFFFSNCLVKRRKPHDSMCLDSRWAIVFLIYFQFNKVTSSQATRLNPSFLPSLSSKRSVMNCPKNQANLFVGKREETNAELDHRLNPEKKNYNWLKALSNRKSPAE